MPLSPYFDTSTATIDQRDRWSTIGGERFVQKPVNSLNKYHMSNQDIFRQTQKGCRVRNYEKLFGVLSETHP